MMVMFSVFLKFMIMIFINGYYTKWRQNSEIFIYFLLHFDVVLIQYHLPTQDVINYNN